MQFSRIVLLTYRNRAVFVSKLEPRQIVILLVTTPFVLLGTSGWTERVAFDSPSMVKYLVTVAVPLVAAAVMLAGNPFLVLVGAAIFLAPAANLKISLVGVDFEALTVVCALAAVPLLLGLTEPVGRTALGRVVPLALVLTAIPLARGTEVSGPITVACGAAAVIFLTARAVQLPGGMAVVLCTGIASLATQAALAIWEYTTKSEFDIYTGSIRSTANYFFDFQGQPRPTGTFFDPISLATSLAIVVPVGLMAVYLLAERRKWLLAAVVTVLIAIVGCGLALTLSRMAVLGTLASLIAIVAFAPRFARARIAAMAAGLLIVLYFVASGLGGASLIERALSVSDPTAANVATADGDKDRELLWAAAKQAGLDHPFSGVGVGNLNAVLQARTADSTEATHAHSVYLQIFAEAGVLGLAALVLLLAGLAIDARHAWNRAPVLTAGLVGAVVALGVAATTDIVTINYESVAASIAPVFGLIVGLARREDVD